MYEHDPKVNWQNNLRVQFIKGIYQMQSVVETLFDIYERTGKVSHGYIDRLLERHLRVLKDVSHVLYRLADDSVVDRKQQRLFDKFLGELWHELDKVRDNTRLLEVYGTEDVLNNVTKMRGLRQLDRQVLAAARRDLPVQLRRARRLLARLIPLFEGILPLYRNNEVIVRTLYFARDFFDKTLGRPSTEHFFNILFPGGISEGYQFLARSLEQTHHLDHARDVYEEAVRVLSETRPKDSRLPEFRERLATLVGNHKRLPDFPATAALTQEAIR
ncbi:MAG: hypothetical protein ABIH23_11850 [bacterium]